MTARHTDHPPRREADGDAGARFESIAEAECWPLLAGATVGRVAVIVGGYADIFPVNFTVDRSDEQAPAVLFRTDPGAKLAGLGRHPLISLEVDDLDLTDHTGWSIVVKGHAQQVRELADDERHRIEQIPVDNWDDAPKRHWIRLEPARVTGRRIGPVPTGHLVVDDAGLPTLAQWTERDVWVPPEHAGAGS